MRNQSAFVGPKLLRVRLGPHHEQFVDPKADAAEKLPELSGCDYGHNTEKEIGDTPAENGCILKKQHRAKDGEAERGAWRHGDVVFPHARERFQPDSQPTRVKAPSAVVKSAQMRQTRR